MRFILDQQIMLQNIMMDIFRMFVFTKVWQNTPVTFVVPSRSDILPDTPSGVSGSSKLTKITMVLCILMKLGDYLSTASSSDFTMGTGDFTVECFLTKDSNNIAGIYKYQALLVDFNQQTIHKACTRISKQQMAIVCWRISSRRSITTK